MRVHWNKYMQRNILCTDSIVYSDSRRILSNFKNIFIRFPKYFQLIQSVIYTISKRNLSNLQNLICYKLLSLFLYNRWIWLNVWFVHRTCVTIHPCHYDKHSFFSCQGGRKRVGQKIGILQPTAGLQFLSVGSSLRNSENRKARAVPTKKMSCWESYQLDSACFLTQVCDLLLPICILL